MGHLALEEMKTWPKFNSEFSLIIAATQDAVFSL